nr:MAG TPA: hypothetical protein [Caudoviricetes sp.]
MPKGQIRSDIHCKNPLFLSLYHWMLISSAGIYFQTQRDIKVVYSYL